MRSRQIALSDLIEFCREQADTHKIEAAGAEDKTVRNDHLARAVMAEFIADHFGRSLPAVDLSSPDVQSLARENQPELFGRYDAMIQRLCDEGHDPSNARRVAWETYGGSLDEALRAAADGITAELTSPQDFDHYSRGFEDAVQWHLAQALEADRLAMLEQSTARQARYHGIAKRHRTYAAHLRSQLASKHQHVRSGREHPDRAEEDGIPIEVQRAFLKKGEVMDDEGWG